MLIVELFQLGVDPVALEWYHQKPENISRQFKSIRKVAWDLLPEKDLNENAMNMVIDSLDEFLKINSCDIVLSVQYHKIHFQLVNLLCLC